MQTRERSQTNNGVTFPVGRHARATLDLLRAPLPDRRRVFVTVSDADRPQPLPDPVLRATAPPAADARPGGVGGVGGVAVHRETATAPPASPAGLHLEQAATRPARVTATGLRLLLVDDDVSVCQEVTQALEAFLGASVCSAGSAKGALDAVAAEHFDAVILEVGLPDGDGCDLCAAIRGRGLAMPIVMLSRFKQETDVVRGLDAGAHDYVLKPFRPYELAARVRAQLRLSEASEHVEVRVGNQIFHSGRRTLSEPGQLHPVRLSVKEAALLKFLHRANGKMVSRKELLHHVWGYHAGAQTNTIASHVYRLRGKVEPRSDSPRVLFHEPGGYRLLRPDTLSGIISPRIVQAADPA